MSHFRQPFCSLNAQKSVFPLLGFELAHPPLTRSSALDRSVVLRWQPPSHCTGSKHKENSQKWRIIWVTTVAHFNKPDIYVSCLNEGKIMDFPYATGKPGRISGVAFCSRLRINGQKISSPRTATLTSHILSLLITFKFITGLFFLTFHRKIVEKKLMLLFFWGK